MPRTRRAMRLPSAGIAILVAACVGPAWAGDPKAGPVPPAGTVRVEGVVSYDGPLPEPIPVAEAGTVRHLVEVEPKAKGLKEAVVWLEGVPRPARSGDEAPEEPVVMDQQNYFFVPHVLAVEAGRAVEFRNGDVANHGVTASSPERGESPQRRHAAGRAVHAPLRGLEVPGGHRLPDPSGDGGLGLRLRPPLPRRHGRAGRVPAPAGAAGAVHAARAAPRRRPAAAGGGRGPAGAARHASASSSTETTGSGEGGRLSHPHAERDHAIGRGLITPGVGPPLSDLVSPSP